MRKAISSPKTVNVYVECLRGGGWMFWWCARCFKRCPSVCLRLCKNMWYTFFFRLGRPYKLGIGGTSIRKIIIKSSGIYKFLIFINMGLKSNEGWAYGFEVFLMEIYRSRLRVVYQHFTSSLFWIQLYPIACLIVFLYCQGEVSWDLHVVSYTQCFQRKSAV